MSTTTTFLYGFDDLVNGVNAVMPHCSKDDVTKIITGIHMAADGKLVATDRYSVGEYVPERFRVTGDSLPDVWAGIVLSPELVKWVAKMRPATLSMGKYAVKDYGFAIVVDSSTPNMARVELRYGVTFENPSEPRADDVVNDGGPNAEQSATFPLLAGNYPPVARLFPDVDDASKFGLSGPISLKTEFLTRFNTAVKWAGGRQDTAKFRFMVTENPNKPGPVFVEIQGDSQGVPAFRGLLQPNLLLR